MMRILVLIVLVFNYSLSFAKKKGYVSTPDGSALVEYEIEDGIAVMEGDILIDPSDTEEELTIDGAGRWFKKRRWPNKTIPYVIDPNLPNVERIHWAINHYHTKTDIKLIPRTNEKSYVYFKYNGANGGCSSFIGRRGKKKSQVIRIPDWCGAGSVVHEIGHALGLVHEQNRDDRDKYLTIHWDNIIFKQRGNFTKSPFRTEDYTDFDFDSIMLYHPFGFAIDPTKPTITKVDGTLYNTQRDGLSDLDMEALAKMYND